MKTPIFVSILMFFFTTFADEPAIKVESAGCAVDSQNNCGANDITGAIDDAASKSISKFNNLKDLVIKNQSDTCQSTVSEFNGSCNANEYTKIKINVEDIKEVIQTKISKLTSIQKMSSIEQDYNGTDISALVKKMEDLVKEIEAAKSFLAEQQNDLDTLNDKCTTGYNEVKMVCKEPTVTTNGDQLIIYQSKTDGLPIKHPLNTKANGEDTDAVATVKLQMEGQLDAPEIVRQQEVVTTSYYTTSRVGGTTSGALNETTNFADTSLTQANLMLAALRPIVPAMQETGCIGFDCPPASAQPQTSPQVGANLPLAMGTPVDGASTPSNKTASGAGNGNNGGVSGNQVVADAQSGAYGAPGDTGSNSGNAAGGSAQGGIGNAMSGLSSLSSMFGKTSSGGFGNDSSYASSSSGRRYNNSGGSAGNYAIPTDTTYNPNNYTNNDNNLPNMPNQRAFNGGNPANSGYGSTPNNASGSSLGSSNSNKGSNNNSKPSFLSRLFGKKDKTFLGKNINGNGGSYGSSSRSGKSGSGSFDRSMNKDNALQKTDARSFDASKYAPSKAAQDRAYARATGRKIASHSSGGEYLTEWPNDISKNKKTSMFVKVGLAHKIQKLDK